MTDNNKTTKTIITGRLEFHKPEIIRNIPQVAQTNVTMPNPFINFHTKYTSKLFINNEEQEDVENNKCLLGNDDPIIAVSPFGFYVECILK